MWLWDKWWDKCLTSAYTWLWFIVRWGSEGDEMGRNPKPLSSFIYRTIKNSSLSFCVVCLLFLPSPVSSTLSFSVQIAVWKIGLKKELELMWKKVNLVIHFFQGQFAGASCQKVIWFGLLWEWRVQRCGNKELPFSVKHLSQYRPSWSWGRAFNLLNQFKLNQVMKQQFTVITES